ncbi:hypothetical protein [Escherichia coli]|uniref:hypothetical protein n=1 Tax=Escherichia coli TaxID=562 RepID=UPI0034E5F044
MAGRRASQRTVPAAAASAARQAWREEQHRMEAPRGQLHGQQVGEDRQQDGRAGT